MLTSYLVLELLGMLLLIGLNTYAGEQFTFCFIQNVDKTDRETTSMIASNDDRTNVTLVNTTDQYQIYREDGVHLIHHTPIATLQNTGKDNKGLSVITEGNIPIVSFNRAAQISGDMFTPFPDSQLGTDHVVLTYCDAVSHCILAIVGVIDGPTDVIIVFPSTFKGVLLIDNKQYQAGERLYITLFQLETFQLLSAANLSGVIVRSTHKIGVYVGSDRTRLGNRQGYDHLEEALPPLTLWGKQYVLIRNGEDVVQILSSANETQVDITTCDRTVHYVINAIIDVIEFLMGCSFCHVSASHPILVAHFMTATSAWKRKLNSANDDRPSSQGIGLLAAVFLTCVFGSVVLIDLTNFIAKKTSKTKN